MSTRFVELVVEADERLLRGFIAGYRAGAGGAGLFFIHKEHGIGHDSRVRQAAEKARLVGNVSHILVAAKAVSGLMAAIEAEAEGLKMRVVEQRAVTGAYCEFSWRVYSREEAERARRLCEEHPTDVVLEGYEPTEEVHEESREQGMYAPAHPYKAEATGTARGDPQEIVEWVSRLREDDFIQVQPIALEYGDETG